MELSQPLTSQAKWLVLLGLACVQWKLSTGHKPCPVLLGLNWKHVLIKCHFLFVFVVVISASLKEHRWWLQYSLKEQVFKNLKGLGLCSMHLSALDKGGALLRSRQSQVQVQCIQCTGQGRCHDKTRGVLGPL